MLLGTILQRHAIRQPDRCALVIGDRRVSWRELNEGANRVAQMMLALGAKPGDRILLLLNNRVEFVEAFYGLGKVGCMSAPVMPTLVASEVAYIASTLRARYIIAEAGAEELAHAACAEVDSVEAVIGVGAGHGFALDYRRLTADASSAEPVAAVRPEDPVTVKFTSGTTGSPKGCARSHYGYTMGALSFTHEFPLRENDIGLIAQPLAAGMALYFLTIYVFRGVTTIMLPKFDAAAYLRAVETERVTHATTMDWMMRRLTADPHFATTDFSSVRILHGVNILSSLDALRTQGTFSGGVTAGYASSEAGGLVTFKTPEDFERCFVDPDADVRTSCGRAGLVNEVACLDEAGAPAPVGEIGELAVRGPTLFLGYWERPEDTQRALRNGWLLTGDLAYEDADGYLYLRGRARDVVRSAGMNIYPAEVEPVLLAYPKIVEAALIGRPDAEWGEVAVACVVAREPCTESELLAFCRERLAGHKRPKEIVFFDAMPMTASGKVIKRELLAMLPPRAVEKAAQP